METDFIPLGEISQRRILDHVIAVGDESETSYLEVKSVLDLTKSDAIAKVAKFLLGAANRPPKEAARYFHGYAVLMIGAQKGEASGVDRGVEAHQLGDRLGPYLGPQFPDFEFGRVSVSEAREVLFVVAQPPRDGQPIFPCHKNFHGQKNQEKLDNGAIYVRGHSNTRSATAGEVLALVERARGAGKSPINLEVEVLGPINRVSGVEQLLEDMYDSREKEFTKPKTIENPLQMGWLPPPAILGHSQPPSKERRTESLEAWRHDRPIHIEEGRAHFLGVALPGAGIRVVSHDRYVAKPHLVLTFHDCEAVEYYEADDADLGKVVKPILQARSPFDFAPAQPMNRIVSRQYPVTWSNEGTNVEVILTPDSFRPNAGWLSDRDDYVLLARDPEAPILTVSWVLTEEGNDATTTGEFNVEPGELKDARPLMGSKFFKR